MIDEEYGVLVVINFVVGFEEEVGFVIYDGGLIWEDKVFGLFFLFQVEIVFGGFVWVYSMFSYF